MKINIINGPNLNLLGKREKSIYGDKSFDEYLDELKQRFPKLELHYFQSNIEGEIIDEIQKSDGYFDGIILNAGGYTHTSVAIADAIASIDTDVLEVHISNIQSREDFRKTSLIAPNCLGSIAGFGLKSYDLALFYLSDSN